MKRALAIAMFPGVIWRESMRLVACKLTGTAVFRGRFFAGTVMHEKVTRPAAALWLAALPMNAAYLAAVVLLLPVALATMLGALGWIEYGLLWLALSLAIQGAPSAEDAVTARGLSRFGVLLYAAYLLGPVLGILAPATIAWLVALSLN
jgi:hypothetical protein